MDAGQDLASGMNEKTKKEAARDHSRKNLLPR